MLISYQSTKRNKNTYVVIVVLELFIDFFLGFVL